MQPTGEHVVDLPIEEEEEEDNMLLPIDWENSRVTDPSILVTISRRVLMHQARRFSKLEPLCGTVTRTFGTSRFKIGQQVVWFALDNVGSTDVLVPAGAAAVVPLWMDDLEAMTFAEAAVPNVPLAAALNRDRTQHMVVVDVLRPAGVVAARLAKVHGVKRVVGVTSETRYDQGEADKLCELLQLDHAVIPARLRRETRGADMELSMASAVFDATERPAVMRFVESAIRHGTCYVGCDRSRSLACLRFRQVGRQIRFACKFCSYIEGHAWFGPKEARVFGPQLESILEVLDQGLTFQNGRAVARAETSERQGRTVAAAGVSSSTGHVPDPTTDAEIERSFGVDLSAIEVTR